MAHRSGPRKFHCFNGLAGCVTQKIVRRTGTLVGIYVAAQADLDETSGPYVTVCEVHGNLVNHESAYLARYHMIDPTMWCAECAALFPDKDKKS